MKTTLIALLVFVTIGSFTAEGKTFFPRKKCAIKVPKVKEDSEGNQVKHGLEWECIRNGPFKGRWIHAGKWNKGKKEGKWVRASGETVIVCSYSKGHLHGKCVHYNNGKQKYIVTSWNNGRKHGKSVTYWLGLRRKGPRVIGNFHNGKKSGVWSFFDDGGRKVKVESYQKGLPSGVWIQWRSNKKIKQKISYLHGKRHGISVHFYKNGQKKSQSKYLFGALSSRSISWFQNGMKASESFYMNGKLHGRSRTWHKSTGKKASEAFFHLGQTHGPAHKWYSNGKKESRNIYYYNMYDKLQYYWYPNGKIKKLLNYSRGRLCGAELYFDKSGARTRKVPRGSCSYKNHRETGFANLYGKVLIPNDNHQRYLDRLLDKKAINARYCLEKSLSKKFMFTVPIKKGKIVFEVTLSRRGRINHVKINAKSGRKKVQSCLVRIMKRWRFFRSKKQAKVKIIFHFAIF